MNFQVQQREKIEETCEEKENPRLPDIKQVFYRCGKEYPVKIICEEIYEYPEKYAVHAYKEYRPGNQLLFFRIIHVFKVDPDL